MSTNDEILVLKWKLVEKILLEIEKSLPYEAMMYVITFVGRKQRLLPRADVASLCITGIETLLDQKEYSYAGTLCNWYVNLDAFSLNIEKIEDINESDFGTLLRVIDTIPTSSAYLFVEKIFDSLTRLINANETLSKPMARKIVYIFKQHCAIVFRDGHQWKKSLDCFYDLHDMKSVAEILHLWASEGYKTEYPIFFARTYLTMLSSNQRKFAASFFTHSKPYIDSMNIDDDFEYYTAHIWNFVSIIADIMGLPEGDARFHANKSVIYNQLLDKYCNIVKACDLKLYNTCIDVGEALKAPTRYNFSNSSVGSVTGMSLI